VNGTALVNGTTTGAKLESVPPAKQEEAEIDHLRRRLEETERAMERIMKQMSSVSHKLNAAKINTNIRALKQELWGSADSLASESLLTDYSMSLDSRTGGGGYEPNSLITWSETTAPRKPAAPPVSDDTVATAVSRLVRSVSQLSLELETAAGAAEDEVSLPAETGAELSELEAEEADAGVEELRHDGDNATETGLASIEDDLDKATQALKRSLEGRKEATGTDREAQPGTKEATADRVQVSSAEQQS